MATANTPLNQGGDTEVNLDALCDLLDEDDESNSNEADGSSLIEQNEAHDTRSSSNEKIEARSTRSDLKRLANI